MGYYNVVCRASPSHGEEGSGDFRIVPLVPAAIRLLKRCHVTATSGTIQVQAALYETLPPRVKGLARQTNFNVTIRLYNNLL